MSQSLLAGVASVGAGDAIYVEDVFASSADATYAQKSHSVKNGIKLGPATANGTVLHVRGNGNLTDSSPFPCTLTAVGSANYTASSPKYGSGCISIPSGGGNYIRVDNGDFDIGLGDFTIEMWLKLGSVGSSYNVPFCIGNGYNNTYNHAYFIFMDSGLGDYLYFSMGGNNGYNLTQTTYTKSSFNGTWHHVAATRENGTVRFFIDGNLLAASFNDTTYVSGSGGVRIGEYWYSYSNEQTYVDDLRVIKGRALYTAAFTPPAAELSLDTADATNTGYGGMVWTKIRGEVADNAISDTARGTNKNLSSNSTAAQGTQDHVTKFNNDGFSMGSFGNLDGRNVASWTFRKQEKFFDVVTYTATGSDQVISHSLGSTPGFILIKKYSSTGNWWCSHRSLTNKDTYYLNLNSTGTEANNGSNFIYDWTSSSFSVAGGQAISDVGATYVAYLFAHNAGGFGATGTDNVISCGSYIGNGTATGPTVNLGYEPQFIMIKKATANSGGAGDWFMYDNVRGLPVSGNDSVLKANSSGSEDSSYNTIQISATGFVPKIDTQINANNDTYIYIAIRRPMKPPTTGTDVFKTITYTGTGSERKIYSGFAPDATLIKRRDTSGDSGGIYDRLHGPTVRFRPDSYSYSDGTSLSALNRNGFGLSTTSYNGSGQTFVSYCFKRAPKFFDVVRYVGTGSSQVISHNLTVAPEMIINKNYNDIRTWKVYHSSLGSSQNLQLDNDNSVQGYNYFSPITSTSFTVGDYDVNYPNDPHTTYLFASCPNVSKVGYYTGTGTTNQINCGFTNGARFVLIKRSDDVGNWFFWDSIRGVISGNDPYLILDDTIGEVTNTDYIDPYSAGFEISSSAPAAINANGGNFIYLAIA